MFVLNISIPFPCMHFYVFNLIYWYLFNTLYIFIFNFRLHKTALKAHVGALPHPAHKLYGCHFCLVLILSTFTNQLNPENCIANINPRSQKSTSFHYQFICEIHVKLAADGASSNFDFPQNLQILFLEVTSHSQGVRAVHFSHFVK